jgi:hypothetical protein
MSCRSVVVCASKRYRHEVKTFCDDLEAAGIVVYRPNIQEPIFEDKKIISEHVTNTIFKGLTLEHFDLIRKADVCFIYNAEQYVGISVTLEMGFANALGKPIYALDAKTGDPCRDALINKVARTAEELKALL